MTLEAVFHDLCLHCQTLHEVLGELRLTVVEDKPLTGDIILVERLGNTVDDFLGWLEEMYTAAAEGKQAVQPPRDLERARYALLRGHARFNDLLQNVFNDLLCHDRIAELLGVGQERGGEWHPWTDSVKQALEGCRQPLFEVNHALFRCWQEIGERLPVAVSTCKSQSVSD